MALRSKQLGYLLEVPVIIAAVALLLAVFLPMLPKTPAKIFLVGGVLVAISGLYYLLVIPGWQAGNAARLRPPWNLMVFIAIALLLLFFTAAYVMA